MAALAGGKQVASSFAGLFASPTVQQAPTPTVIATPTVNQAIVSRSSEDVMRQRRGQAATITGAGNGTTSGSVAAKTLLGQ